MTFELFTTKFHRARCKQKQLLLFDIVSTTFIPSWKDRQKKGVEVKGTVAPD
jgi:hypothetical protein